MDKIYSVVMQVEFDNRIHAKSKADAIKQARAAMLDVYNLEIADDEIVSCERD